MDPFAAPPPSGNPFAQPQPDPYGSSGMNGMQSSGNPFDAPSPNPQQQQYGYQQQPPPQFQQQPQPPHTPMQQQPPQFQQQQQTPDQMSYQSMPPQQQPQQGYDPFSQSPHQQQTQALVPSQQPSNPYAIVQHTQQNNQWSVGAQQPPASPASFDPFAAPPAPPQQQSQAMVPVTPDASSPYPGSPPYQQPQQQPYQQPPQEYQQQQHQQQEYQQQFSQPPPQEFQQQPPSPPREERHSPVPPSRSPVNERSMVPAPSSGYPGAPPPEAETPKGVEARNKYSSVLAQEAPMGASPLPKADMVRKTGYVLSRISFRTIVMKKWKQSFWVQYGPHTMLWFRSQSDFDDWLNNPYHTQAQRNFLIKLAVNFAHDLYKPNVRGYQVTQCRTKSYGTKTIRQFKLERWMDYGPTIAAAFGSNNPKEVDDLREALVACMRNTPLNGGIRATGAVREREDQQGYDSHRPPHGADRGVEGGHHDAASYGGHANSRPGGNRSVASANDALHDQGGFDDANSLGDYPASAAPAPPVDLLDFSEPVQTQPPPQQFAGSPPPGQPYPMQQQQQNPQMQHNPYGQQQYSMPPQQQPQQQQFQGGPPMQQGPYPGSPPPGQPYGANPHMQQQYPPGQAPPQQAYGGF